MTEKQDDELDPNDLWEACKKPLQFEIVNLTVGNDDMGNKKEFPIRMEVLKANQVDECKINAMNYFKNKSIANPTEEILNDRIIKEVLWYAAKKPKTKSLGDKEISFPVFPTPDAVGELPADAIRQLFTLYLMTQHRFSNVDRLVRSKDDLEAFILRLVEGGHRDPLAAINSLHLVEILLALAMEYYVRVLQPKLQESSALQIENLLSGTGYSIELPAELFGDSIQPNGSESEPGLMTDKEAIEAVKKPYSEPKPIDLNTPAQQKALSDRLNKKKR